MVRVMGEGDLESRRANSDPDRGRGDGHPVILRSPAKVKDLQRRSRSRRSTLVEGDWSMSLEGRRQLPRIA